MAKLLASTSSCLPVTPLIPEGAKAKPHIILFLSPPSRHTFHYTSPVHPTRTSMAISENLFMCFPWKLQLVNSLLQVFH